MKKQKKVWKMDGNVEIPVEEMTTDHLTTAFLSIARRQFDEQLKINYHHDRINTFYNLKLMLEEELKRRGAEPVYPDQREGTFKYGNYFKAERKERQVTETVSTKAVISADSNQIGLD